MRVLLFTVLNYVYNYGISCHHVRGHYDLTNNYHVVLHVRKILETAYYRLICSNSF